MVARNVVGSKARFFLANAAEVIVGPPLGEGPRISCPLMKMKPRKAGIKSLAAKHYISVYSIIVSLG